MRLQAAENKASEDMNQRRRNEWGMSVAEAYGPYGCAGHGRPPWDGSDSDRGGQLQQRGGGRRGL